MQKLLRFLCLAVFLTTITSCERIFNKDNVEVKQTINVQGQIFITQKNRVNVKLGGVEIYAIPKATFLKKIKLYEIENQATLSLLEQTDDDLVILNRHHELFTSLAYNTFDLPSDQAAEVIAYLKKIELSYADTVEELVALTDKHHLGKLEIRWDKTIHDIFSKKIKNISIEKTSSDADGKFSLGIKSDGPIFIVAKAPKDLSQEDSGENFFWIYEVKESKDNIFLTSNSALTSDDLDLLVSESGYTHEETANRARELYTIESRVNAIMSVNKELNELNDIVKKQNSLVETLLNKHGEYESLDKEIDEITQQIEELKSQAK